MSLRTLPLLYVNLGGEMMYIIEERLEAQSVPIEKSANVLTDLISLMFNPKIMEEILIPQEIHTKDALQVIFENISNATSMRVDADSLGRMYSIMVMSVKYQIQRCGAPRDLLGIALNHMDGLRGMLNQTSRAHLLLEKAYDVIVEAYKDVSPGELGFIRQTLLMFFHDSKARVRKFIEAGQQSSRTGRFTIPLDMVLSRGIRAPIQFRYVDQNGKVMKMTMVHEERASYTEQDGVISWANFPRDNESRGTYLGKNIHKFGNLYPAAIRTQNRDDVIKGTADSDPDMSPKSNDQSGGGGGGLRRPMSRQELSLLRTVIDSRGGQPNSTFRLNLYNRKPSGGNHTGPPAGLIPNGRSRDSAPEPRGRGNRATTRVVLPKINKQTANMAKKTPAPLVKN